VHAGQKRFSNKGMVEKEKQQHKHKGKAKLPLLYFSHEYSLSAFASSQFRHLILLAKGYECQNIKDALEQ
jgi:hypothetical protein